MSKRRKYLLAFLAIWAVQMAAAFCFCVQKQGFHEDEYYTYYSTARTNGFYVEDGQWMDRDTYRNEFVVLPGQGFQYGLVKLVQSWDVHPPVYYWVFHTVGSLAAGVFSKWIGLSVNLVFWGMNIGLLAYLAYEVSGQSESTALLATLFFGLSPAAMSGVVFIRMYEMLTTFVLLCALLHVRAVRRKAASEWEKLPVFRCLLPMAAVTYLGFLTQYYYFIFLFFLGAAFCLWLLWRDRKIRDCLKYAVSQGIAFLLAYATYPSCLGQMFRGQRGAQATENFFDLSNTAQRVRFFGELLDEYVFGKTLPVAALLLLLLLVTAYGKRRLREAGRAADAAYWILAAAAAGYFLTVCKTALLLGDTSNRYQLPVYGIIVLLFLQAVRVLWRQAAPESLTTGPKGKYFCLAAALICLALDLTGLVSDRVVFLYPEDRQQVAFAAEKAGEQTPAVYLYQPGEEWCVWDVTDELLAYPKVYFAAADREDAITDDAIGNADALVVYIAEGADIEAQTDRILKGSRKLSEGRKVFEEKYCGVYLFR